MPDHPASRRFVSIAFSIPAFVMLGMFPGWRREEGEGSNASSREVKPFPSRISTQAVLVCLAVCSVLATLTSFWQHLSSAAASTMADFFTHGSATGRVGAGAMALGWIASSMFVLAFIGMLVMYLSIKILRDMIED